MSLGRYKKSPRYTFGDMLATGFLIGVFGGFLIVVAMYLVVREQYTFITDVRVSGNSVISAADIQQATRIVLREDCFMNVSCEYGLWLPVERIEAEILRAFPRMHGVKVRYLGDGLLVVHVSERAVSFRFCSDSQLKTCYFADDEGVLFERAPRLSDLRYIPTIYPDTTKITVGVNPQHLPVRLWNSDEVYQYNQLKSLVAPYGRIYHVSYSKRDIDVQVDKLYDYLIANNTAVLKFNRESLGNSERTMYINASLDRLISFQPFASKFKVSPQSLEYLDLRFPKRLYMKFVKEEPETKEVTKKV